MYPVMKTKGIQRHSHKPLRKHAEGRGVAHGIQRKKPDIHPALESKVRKHDRRHGGEVVYGGQRKTLKYQRSVETKPSTNSISWLRQAPGSPEQKASLRSFVEKTKTHSMEAIRKEWGMFLDDKENVAFLQGLQKRGMLSKLLDCFDMWMALGLVEKEGLFDEFVLGEKVHSDEGWRGWFWSLVSHFSPFHSKLSGGYVLQRMEALAKSKDTAKFEQGMSDVMGYVVRFHVKDLLTSLNLDQMNGDVGQLLSSVSGGLGETGNALENLSDGNRNVVIAVAEVINKKTAGLGDLWKKAYLDVYEKGASLGMEDWWLAAQLAGECNETEPGVFEMLDILNRSPLSRESKDLIREIISVHTNASFSLRGAHYVFAHDDGRSYEKMCETFGDEVFQRGGLFTQQMYRGHGIAKSLRTRFLASSHYGDQRRDPRLKPQMGIDIPGLGHLLFGQRIKKDLTTGEERVESWFQFEAHGAHSVFDYVQHGMDYFRHRRSSGAQVGPLGLCRHSEKSGTELEALSNLGT
jgi:hypothetical protein